MLLILIQINGYSQKGAPKVNIDQGDNGQSSVPNSPVIWVNGNLNTTKTHYIEGQSIPYRISLDNIPLGTPITVRIGFDLRNSGHFAIDYLTSDTFAFKHAVFFKHPPEKVIPELGIPDPIVITQYAPLPDPGNKNSPTGWSQQPQASFDLVKAAGNANMALKNAVFQSNPVWVSGKSPDYSESNSSFEAQMDVTIVASALPVIIGFGGHIASRFDWGTLPNGQARSAGGISGSPYHMRVIQLDYNGSITSIGNQDRSLQIAAPECLNLSVLISNQQNLLCNGTGSGSVLLSSSGGTPGFQFSIDSGKTYQFSNLFSGLAPGDYLFTVRDTIGCTNTVSTTISSPPVLSKSGIVSNILCFGAENGSIDLSVSGGTPGYTYAWSNGATSQDLSGLSAGTYSVLITDVNNCEARDTFQISQPASAILASANITDILCYGDNTGAIDLSVSGGTASYTYEWLTGQTTQDLSGLQAGVYSVLITDANGCTKRDTFTIKQPDAALAVAFKHVDVLCYGDSTGSIDMTVTDGTKPYSFVWSNGSVTEDLSNLKEGTYVVLVTDDNGCVVKDSVEIDQPLAPLAIEHKKVDVLCYSLNTGSIDLSVSGGSPDYSYAWSNGATSQDLFNLTAGIYTVVVTDQSGCIKKDTIEIIEPAAGLSIKAAIKDLDCFGVATGGIDLTVEGGTAAYSYSWSNGATTEDLSGIAAGIYSVTVTDSNLCFLKDTFEVKQPDASLDFSLKQVDVLCYGDSSGSIDLDVTGGTKPYSYTWSNGATTEDLSNVKAGVYAVLVTDDKGCSKEDSIEVLQPKSALSVRAKITDVLCKGDETGSIDITVSGGTASYQFSWSSGEDTEDISGKSAGVYYVLITDANQCTLKDTFEIEEPTEKLSVSGSATDLKCYNDQSGSIDITVAGGIVSYSYSWSNGSTSEDLTGISAGTYTVTVTDKNGCFVKETFVVNQPDPLVVNADDKKVCAGVSVDLTASPSGGVWSGSGVTGSAFMSEVPGIYAVYYTYTNLSGCVGIDTAYVNVERCSQGFCTYTQGYYGNPGGKSCAEGLKYSTKGLMQLALSKGSIVLGNASLNRTFTIAYNSVDTVIAILPGGGPAGMLAYTGNRTPSKLPPAMLKNGKINNVLLSQTIALSFNLRVNSELDSFKVRSDKFLMTQDKVSCESKDVKDCAYHSYKFSSKVVNALNGNKTIADLLKLANNALAGSLPAGLSYSDVAGAVDLVNNAFDGCKVGWYSDTVVYCPIVDVSSSASNISANEQPVQLNIEQMAKQPTVKPYPNPFEDMVRFTIESPESIQCNLILYTSAGRMISKVFDGKVEANVSTTVQALVPSMYKGAIMYVLSYNGKVVTGTVLKK
ncbi:MAG: SprB repeat-containing protein [Bacteroidota bacterium]